MKYFSFLFLSYFSFFSIASGAPPYPTSQTTPKVVIETIAGDITVELFPAQAPITVNNFLQYVNSGFYDGLIIHRVVNDANFSIMQGGGYLPGGTQRTQGLRPPIINESYNGLSNLRGTLAMARTNDSNSATSGFYINDANNIVFDRGYLSPSNPGYCVFGQVISGMDVVDQIVQLPTLLWWPQCPYLGNNYVYIYRQQVRVCVSPGGNDSTGLGSVDAPLKTIQKAIDVINEPGHVVPAPATYTGAGNIDLDFKGKAITVRSIEPHDANTVTKTVIDCQADSSNRHRAFYFHTGEDANSIVQGLTILNGCQTAGGAFRCENSSPTVKNCTIANNTALSYGGGISCYNSKAVISNCTFAANTGVSRAGALCCDSNSGVSVLNSILWNNSAALGTEIALSDLSLPSTVNISYSDVDGGLAQIYTVQGCSAVWGPGNIDMDPCFVNPAAGDYHLQSRQGQWSDAGGWAKGLNTSPCIDRGNPGSLLGYELADSNNLRIDMGSFGGTTKAGNSPAGWGLLADLDNNGMITNSDFAWFAGFWLTQGIDLPADFNGDRIVDITDLKIFSYDWQQFMMSFLAKKADFSKDGLVNFKDFILLANQWQQQGTDKTCDLNGDVVIDIHDVEWLAIFWLQ